MQALSSSILIISKNKIPKINLDFVHGTSWPLKEDVHKIQVFAVESSLLKALYKNIQLAKENRPDIQWLLLAKKEDMDEKTLEIINALKPVRISSGVEDPLLENYLMAALEQAQLIQQNLDLQKIVQEQKIALQKLYEDLEDRVEKRQRFLEDARKKTYIANSRWGSVRKASEAIHQATSVGEMEKLLTEALAEPLQLSLTRILLRPQDEAFARQTSSAGLHSVFQAPLKKELSSENNGSVFFLRQKARPFHRDETEFLQKITEAVSLSLSRLLKLEQMESLLEQWQATFNAVSDPVCMINSNYEIVQSNNALLLKTGLRREQIIQSKCYAVLFNRSQPCQGCERGKNFRVEGARGKQQMFEVYSQNLYLDSLKEKLFIHQYQEITEQLRIEKKIMESAKLAELGTIGSSIAHELNNPLGGILSFVQLIKMDLKPENPIYNDIVEMEVGVLRCRDIIQNLLGFTRKASEDSLSAVDLKEIFERALKIIELQARSRGIEIKLQWPESKMQVQGSLSLLSQAIQNLLQKSLDSIEAKNNLQRGFHGVIEIRISRPSEWIEIIILDNGLESEAAPGLGIPVASQIIHDHGGEIHIDSSTGPFRLAKISLPSLVLKNKSPGF